MFNGEEWVDEFGNQHDLPPPGHADGDGGFDGDHFVFQGGGGAAPEAEPGKSGNVLHLAAASTSPESGRIVALLVAALGDGAGHAMSQAVTDTAITGAVLKGWVSNHHTDRWGGGGPSVDAVPLSLVPLSLALLQGHTASISALVRAAGAVPSAAMGTLQASLRNAVACLVLTSTRPVAMPPSTIRGPMGGAEMVYALGGRTDAAAALVAALEAGLSLGSLISSQADLRQAYETPAGQGDTGAAAPPGFRQRGRDAADPIHGVQVKHVRWHSLLGLAVAGRSVPLLRRLLAPEAGVPAAEVNWLGGACPALGMALMTGDAPMVTAGSDWERCRFMAGPR